MASSILNLSIPRLRTSPYQGRMLNHHALKSKTTVKQLNELAASIKSAGLLTPITVRATDDGNYEIIDGHRRVEAYKLLGKGNIPAIIKEGTDRDIQLMSVVANLQRKGLNNLERAIAFEKILSEGLFENKKELSRALGKDETFVGDILNLLKMDSRVITSLSGEKKLTDLRMLRMIRNAEPVDASGKSDKQYKLYLKCVHEKLTRKDLQKLLQKKVVNKASCSLKKTQSGFNIRFSKNATPDQKKKVLSLLESRIKEAITEIGMEIE